MKKILIATIGTRELMFQVNDGTWYNAGNDRQDDDIISQQNQVTESLGLDWEEYKSYRKLTKYIFDHLEEYQERIKPVIWGKLFHDLQGDLEKVYLLCTDQSETVPFRTKDTIYAGQIIAKSLENIGLSVEIITFGRDGINPSDFEQMFQWWQSIWDKRIIVGDRDLILCLKGGVGQTAEAGRTSALSSFGERVEFYDSRENSKLNQQGLPSEYVGPTLGTNYLWNRVQKEALDLLKNYNYLAVQGLLKAYFERDTKGWGSTPTLLKGAIAWNQGKFAPVNENNTKDKSSYFLNEVKYILSPQQKSYAGTSYGWQAYEQAYTAIIRLKQGNTTEAMQHSFRAIEGLIYNWITSDLQQYITSQKLGGYLLLQDTIVMQYPNLKSLFQKFDLENQGTIQIRWGTQVELIKAIKPTAFTNTDFQAWNSPEARDVRNNITHKLGGISQKELFAAWGKDITQIDLWEKCLLNCLNAITGKSFRSFNQASLLPAIHKKLKDKVESYQL